jgi:hypothetical protein
MVFGYLVDPAATASTQTLTHTATLPDSHVSDRSLWFDMSRSVSYPPAGERFQAGSPVVRASWSWCRESFQSGCPRRPCLSLR